MAAYIDIKTIGDNRGKLSVLDADLPFHVKRIFYIYDVTGNRGGHRHKKTSQLLICTSGSCEVYCFDGKTKQRFTLNEPGKGLLVPPSDWHTMENFSENAVLLVLASESYDPNDYITENYPE